MRRRSFFLRASALAAATVLAACVSQPPTRFHTLMPSAPSARAPSAAGERVPAVLEPIRLPVQVDQPQWLVRLPDDTVAVLEQERWASPLRDELRQALREALITTWGMTEERPAAGATAPVRISIDVRRFDSLISGEARIAGSWTLSGQAPTASMRCEWVVGERTASDVPSLAAAHRRAVARLAAGIGQNLGRVSRGEPVSCPAPESGA